MKVTMITCASMTDDYVGHVDVGQLIPSGMADRTGRLTVLLNGGRVPDTGVNSAQKAEYKLGT